MASALELAKINEATESTTGGYDHDFVDEVQDRYVCSICLKPFRDPHLVVCCGKHFCKSCLSPWTKRKGKKSCPHCRAEGSKFNHVPNKGMRSEVLALQVYCVHRDEGCGWVGELAALGRHINSDSSEGCGYVAVKCPNGCVSHMLCGSGVIRRKDVAHHMEFDCDLRPFSCEYCGFKNTYVDIIFNHYDKCAQYPVECPNICCNFKDVTKKNLKVHRSRCPYERVKCPFKEVGCNNVLRHQYDQHMTEKMQRHLLLMMKAYQDMKVKVESLEEQLQA